MDWLLLPSCLLPVVHPATHLLVCHVNCPLVCLCDAHESNSACSRASLHGLYLVLETNINVSVCLLFPLPSVSIPATRECMKYADVRAVVVPSGYV